MRQMDSFAVGATTSSGQTPDRSLRHSPREAGVIHRDPEPAMA
jgi:hypothetical protein